MKKINLFSYILVVALMLSCQQDILEQEPSPVVPITGLAGTASFTKFVAIGNSLTAGYQAGALFASGQQESLPRIMARQFEYAGGSGTFNQPTITSQNGCYNPSGGCTLGRLVLFDADGTGTAKTPSPTPSGFPGVPAPYNTGSSDGLLAFAPYTGGVATLNNFGVPGILLGQALIPATGGPPTSNPAYSPYYARFASNKSTDGATGSTILSDAITSLANGGTFFLFDLGNNDVLGYATGGGANPSIFTSVGAFTGQYGAAIDALLAVPNVKGVVGNIPNVLSIPFFKLVAYNAIALDATTASTLTTQLANNYNAFLAAMVTNMIITDAERTKRMLTYAAGKNGVLLVDETLTDLTPYMAGPYAGLLPYARARQAQSTDLICLSAGSVLGTPGSFGVRGVSEPVGDQFVLLPTEQTEISDRIVAFNAAIAAKVAASNNRIALADVNATFTAFATAGATQMSGVTLTASISPPYAAFSEDGVHPNGRGYAFMANIFIDAINAKFGATVPQADVSKYKGTQLPLNP